MAIPDYQKLMLPVLKMASDQNEHKFSQAVEELANEFSLTQEERTELLPSGQPGCFQQSRRLGAILP
jgi:restriction system protein